MSEIVTIRDSEIVAAEINTIKEQARRVLLTSAIEIGRRLTEAKAMVPHGEWGKWLQEKVDYSQSTANNMMALYREYGDDQVSLFDKAAKSQAFGNLTYTQALALLAVPAAEREEFAEENHVEDLSTRELQELIRQRDEAEHDRRAAETAQKEAEAAADDLQQRLQAAGSTICDLTAKASQAQKDAADKVAQAQEAEKAAAQAVKSLEEKLEKAKADRDRVQAQLRDAQKNPQVPESVMEQLRKETEAKAKAQAQEKAEKELKKAREAQERAQEAAAQAQKEAEALKAQLVAAQNQQKLQDPETAVFKEAFDRWQKDYMKLQHLRSGIREKDPDKAGKLGQAMQVLLRGLLESLEREVS